MPDERLTREEALRSLHARRRLRRAPGGAERFARAGKLADLVILSHDIMQVPPRDILTTTVVFTVSGGQVTHARPRPPGSPTRMPDIAVPVSLAAVAVSMLVTIVIFTLRAVAAPATPRTGWSPSCGWRRSPRWCSR